MLAAVAEILRASTTLEVNEDGTLIKRKTVSAVLVLASRKHQLNPPQGTFAAVWNVDLGTRILFTQSQVPDTLGNWHVKARLSHTMGGCDDTQTCKHRLPKAM